MKTLFTNDLASGQTNYKIVPGQYGSLLVRYSGTNAAGQTMALADLGTVKLTWNGQDIINVPVSILSQAANLYGGAIESSSTVAAAFAFTIVIPCAAWFDSLNIYDIGVNDNVTIQLINASTLAAKLSSGSVEIAAKPRPGQMSYLHKILQKQVVAGGAGTITDLIPDNNIIELYLDDPATNLVTLIQLTKNGVVVANTSTGEMLAYSNWIHEVEAVTTFLAVEFAESKILSQAAGANVNYQYTFSGAATLGQYYSAIMPVDQNKLQQSLLTAKAATY